MDMNQPIHGDTNVYLDIDHLDISNIRRAVITKNKGAIELWALREDGYLWTGNTDGMIHDLRNFPNSLYVDKHVCIEGKETVLQIVGRDESGLCAHLVCSAVPEDGAADTTNHHGIFSILGPDGDPSYPANNRISIAYKESTDDTWIPPNDWDTQNEHIVVFTELAKRGIIAFWHQAEAEVRKSTTQSIATGGTPSTVLFNQEVRDNQSEYNPATGILTCKEWGTRVVSARVLFSSASWSAGKNINLYLYKNGAHYRTLDNERVEVAATRVVGVGGSTQVHVQDTDTLSIRVGHDQGSARSISTDNKETWASFTKVT